MPGRGNERFDGLKLIANVVQTVENEVWRAIDNDGRNVLVQFPRDDRDEEHARASYLHELEVIRGSGLSARLAETGYRDAEPPHLVYNDEEGYAPLGVLIETGAFDDVDTSLRAAISLALALGELHESGYSHNGLSELTVLCSEDGRCVLSGFAQASSFPECAPRDLNRLVGDSVSLAHMSPEQTGRINRGVDYRTDLYSLGVILFRMLTREYPLWADDTVGWVHAHVAMPPKTLKDVRPHLPAALVGVVSSLLEKNAEDRCQNAFLVADDLRTILGGNAPVATRTYGSPRFVISPAVYGRDREIAALEQAFSRVHEGQCECVFVRGESGVGKTALAQMVQRPLNEAGGLGGSAKYDQFGRSTPHSAVLVVLDELVSKISEMAPEARRAIVQELSTRATRELPVLTDRIPRLETLVGAQPSPPSLSSADAQARFHDAVIEFFKVVASADRPTLLFLDDLQWSDTPSLQLLEELLHARPPGLMLVCCYRDNEVDGFHPLARLRARLVEHCQEVVVGPLSVDDLSTLLLDSFRCDSETATALSRILREKTGGIPFFAKQFLASLHHEGGIRYSFRDRKWLINVGLAQAHAATENVIDLMTRRILAFELRMSPFTTGSTALPASIPRRPCACLNGPKLAERRRSGRTKCSVSPPCSRATWRRRAVPYRWRVNFRTARWNGSTSTVCEWR